MENNEKMIEYYRVYLNRPDSREPNRGYPMWNRSFVFLCIQEQNNKKTNEIVTVFCKNVDGKLFDVITNDEYVYASQECYDRFDSITYHRKEQASVEEVYNSLKKMNPALTKGYINKMNEIFYVAHAKYMSYIDKKRKQQIWEETREEREAKYNDFISNFHKNYGNANIESNTSTESNTDNESNTDTEFNTNVKKKEKKRWNIFKK